MRTKTIILTAALSAATIAGAFAADAVYSVNVVGYSTARVGDAAKAITPQWSLQACPLIQMQSALLKDLIPNPPPSTQISLYNGTTFEDEVFDPDALEWSPGTHTLSFGQGFWVYTAGGPFTITWVGEVADNSYKADQLNMNLRFGWNLVGAKVPLNTTLREAYTTVTPGNIVYGWDDTNHTFIPTTFDQDALEWGPDPNGLELKIGSGLWIYEVNLAGGVWNRNFSIPKN